MDDARAYGVLSAAVTSIDEYGRLYDQRWDKRVPTPGSLVDELRRSEDEVRSRIRFARDLVTAMGERELAAAIEEKHEGVYGGHPFQQARRAIVEATAILAHREELAAIVGPSGPQLSASELHPNIWTAAAALWDGGHVSQAVQTAASALEGLMQTYTGPGSSGAELASLFSLKDPEAGQPRLRFRGVDPTSKTWKSAHEGAAALVRGAFLSVRNSVSHPGWQEPTLSEGLEMLAVLSRVARLIDQCDLIPAP